MKEEENDDIKISSVFNVWQLLYLNCLIFHGYRMPNLKIRRDTTESRFEFCLDMRMEYATMLLVFSGLGFLGLVIGEVIMTIMFGFALIPILIFFTYPYVVIDKDGKKITVYSRHPVFKNRGFREYPFSSIHRVYLAYYHRLNRKRFKIMVESTMMGKPRNLPVVSGMNFKTMYRLFNLMRDFMGDVVHFSNDDFNDGES